MLLMTVCFSVCVAAAVESAAVPEQDCGESFQTKLGELLAMKQSCSSAFYQNCCQIKQLVSSSPNGVYHIRYLAEQSPFNPYTYSHVEARCDMETDGGGWLVIQRRLPNGTVNFTRDWSDYENGFGDLNGEFWYGLRNIHSLTSRDDMELRIDMVMEDDGSELSWTYQTFRVAGASDKYRLTIGGGEGSGFDAMAWHNGQQFSSYDTDNDGNRNQNCAFLYQGGWWYNACYYSNLNGPHTQPSTPGVGLTAILAWYDNDNSILYPLSSAEMKMRVKQCMPQQVDTC